MGLLQKIFSPQSKKSLGLPLVSRIGGSLSSFFSMKKDTQLYTGWVFLCVTVIKDEIANMKLVLQKMDKSGNVEVIHKHPVLDLLSYVNEFFTRYELFERLQADLELTGNHYWVLEKNKQGIPIAIYPVLSSTMTPVSSPEFYVSHYEYRIDTTTYKIPREEVIHFKNYNPDSFIQGLSTVSAVRLTVEGDESAKAYNDMFYKNNAVPSVVLEYPNSLNGETMDTLRQQWEANFSGWKNSHKTAIASGGLKVHQMDVSHADMEFIEQRRFSRDEILAIFRVPPTVAGINEATVYASAKASDYTFSKRNIEPKMQRIVNTLNEFLLYMYGEEGLSFTFISPVPRDTMEQTAYYQSGITHGYLTPNEIRGMEGLPLLQEGDNVFLPMGLAPYTTPVKSLPPKSAVQKIIDVESTVKTLSHFLQPEKKEVKEEETKEELFAGKWTSAEFDEIGEKKAKERKGRLDTYEKKFQSTAQALFDDQKARIIEALESGEKAVKTPDVFDEEEEIDITIDLFTPLFQEVTEKEGREALLALGLDPDSFSINTPSMKEFIKKNTKKFAGEITMKTSQDIRAQLIAGLEQGEAIAGLTQRVKEYSGFDKARAEMIARTETVRASGEAEEQAWKESDVVARKIWYTALDERICTDCEIMHAKEVSLGKPFLDEEGQLELGIEPYTENIDAPPLHPQCRCTMLPVVK